MGEYVPILERLPQPSTVVADMEKADDFRKAFLGFLWWLGNRRTTRSEKEVIGIIQRLYNVGPEDAKKKLKEMQTVMCYALENGRKRCLLLKECESRKKEGMYMLQFFGRT